MNHYAVQLVCRNGGATFYGSEHVNYARPDHRFYYGYSPELTDLHTAQDMVAHFSNYGFNAFIYKMTLDVDATRLANEMSNGSVCC